MVSVTDIYEARERVRGHVRMTPCRRSGALSELAGCRVWLKLENLQYTGSFKERGALSRLLALTEDERAKGVVAASAGNHAQGVAFHAARLGVHATIVMPVWTPMIKVARTRSYGAEVVLVGEDYDEAYDHALEIVRARGAVYVHGYDDPLVIAGQGTVGLELLEQVPDLDAVVVPVGGGGLISGVAVALKAERPDVAIIGVEPCGLESMAAAVRAGGPVQLDTARSLADGIAVRKVGTLCHALASSTVDEWVSVDDAAIARALLHLLEGEKVVAEGAGAAGVAALMTEKVATRSRKDIVLIVSGGNIDVNLLSRIIEHGLVESGRRVQLRISMVDRPGVLADLLSRVAETHANVFEIHHERAFPLADVGQVDVDIVVETRGAVHARELVECLRDAGYRVEQRG